MLTRRNRKPPQISWLSRYFVPGLVLVWAAAVGRTSDAANVTLPSDDQRTTAKTYQAYCESCHFPKKAVSFHLKDGKNIMDATAEEMINNTPAYLTSGPAELARPRPADYQERVYFKGDLYHGSAHGEVYCVDCHASFNSGTQKPLPHSQFLPPSVCLPCHGEEETLWTEGRHGEAFEKKDQDAPNCGKCHSDYHTMRLARTTSDVLHPVNLVAKCASCHGDEGVLARHEDLKQDAVATYMETVHGRGIHVAGLMTAANCSSCHGPHKNLPHDEEGSSISMVQTLKTCGECHEIPAKLVGDSIHGEELVAGNAEAPGCSGCHTPHGEIQVVRPEFQLATVSICGDCHEDNKETYLETYHGKAAAHGGLETARCASCHSFHDLHAPVSEKSTVNEANIVTTCKECHPYSDERWVTFMPHVHPNDPTHPRIYYPYMFMVFLLIGTMGFFAIHSILWLFREIFELGKHRKAAGHVGPLYQRFNLLNRLTHAVLFVSVTGLAVTGLPLRYPTREWALWLLNVLGGVSVAGVLHRIFAALTLLYAGMHFVHLWKIWRKAEKRPFFQWVFGPNSMIPNWTDIKQFFAHLRYFFFLGPNPKFGRWAYWEKFDYWAVFWGVTIIGLSGLVMAFSGLFARILPGWMFNVMLIIHSDEALLAASFLFAIHFFHVHLRPLKFPMDHVMFNGSVNRAEMEGERAAELESLQAEGKLEGLEVTAPNPTQLVVNRVIATVSLLVGLALLVALFYSEIIVRLAAK